MFDEIIDGEVLTKMLYERDEKIRKEREHIYKYGFPKDSYQRTKKSLEEIRELMKQYENEDTE